jgi:hypothetical protein
MTRSPSRRKPRSRHERRRSRHPSTRKARSWTPRPPACCSWASRVPSLAQILHEYGERWEIEQVERGAQWVAVLRETGGDYIRVVSGHDLGVLGYQMS